MANHHIRLFVDESGQIVYIDHIVGNSSGDGPGEHIHAPDGDKVRWVAPRDGGFSIEFKTESPFVSLAGSPGSPITSSNGSQTSLETLKPIATVTKRFPYAVTLGGITVDPELIIDDSGDIGRVAKKAKKKKKK